jgi:hypothetical protein
MQHTPPRIRSTRADCAVRTPVLLLAIVSLVVAAVSPAVAGRSASPAVPLFPNLVVEPDLEPTVEAILELSPTLRRQTQEIGIAPNVRVRVDLTFSMAADRLAQTEFRPSSTGGFEARVEISGPRRLEEYAGLLAHEFEHILEHIEGIDLRTLAGERASGVSRLQGGVYETERAVLAGRRASTEVWAATR